MQFIEYVAPFVYTQTPVGRAKYVGFFLDDFGGITSEAYQLVLPGFEEQLYLAMTNSFELNKQIIANAKTP